MIKNLNPFQTSDVWTKKVIRLMYQPLYLVDPDAQTLTPWLAEDQPVYDTENKTVTFHLRKMKWDDGSDFTAEDVVFFGVLVEIIQVDDSHPAPESKSSDEPARPMG